jgi:hypothetical protein
MLSGHPNTTLEAAPELMCDVACCTMVWSDTFSLPKQLWHPAVTWIWRKTVQSYRNCSVPCSFSKVTYHYIEAWLCVHILIAISKADRFAMLVASLNDPDHGTLHSDFFLWGFGEVWVHQTPWPTSRIWRTELKLIVATVGADMLQRTWMELEYCLGIAHMTNGGNLECM